MRHWISERHGYIPHREAEAKKIVRDVFEGKITYDQALSQLNKLRAVKEAEEGIPPWERSEREYEQRKAEEQAWRQKNRERGKFISEDETDIEKIETAFKNKMNELVPISR